MQLIFLQSLQKKYFLNRNHLFTNPFFPFDLYERDGRDDL